MVTIFDTRYTFFEIDGLKSDFLIGYNLLKTRKNAIVEYLDYQIPVTQREMKICKQQSEIKMRHLPAVERFKRYGR